MKAIQVTQYGGPEVSVFQTNLPEPSPKERQVLVKVYATSINPFDVKLRSGMYKDSIPIQFPYTPGGDFAGEVTKLGEGVTDFKGGDKVYGSATVLSGGSGAFAETAVANIKNIALKPENIDFTQAASLPLVGSSAVQALEEHIKLQNGQRILIHGGSGGIGSIAVQLAKHTGAYVATTVSTDDVDFVKNLGADQVIDYKKDKFEEMIKDYDAVFDTVGGETSKKSFQVIKRGGVMVSMVGKPDPEMAVKFGIIAIGQGTETNSRHLERLAELVDQGAIKPQVDKVFPLKQTSEAFDYLEKGSPRGKVVLKIKE